MLCDDNLSVFGLLSQSGQLANVLLQGTPRNVDVTEVREFLESLSGVQEAHDVHVWALSSNDYALSAHLVVSGETDSDRVLDRSQSALFERFEINHATIQIESPSYSHTVSFDCYDTVRER